MGENNWKKNAWHVENVILREAVENNILPLTSTCNLRCVFCSHLQNPPGVEAYCIPPRTLEEVAKTLPFMDRHKPVVIGESASRILEGEPFSHPRIKKILKLIRSSLPGTPIKITTNGTLLDEESAALLNKLGNIEVCLSLNSAGKAARALLMGDEGSGAALDSPAVLKKYGITFHGSIVAMPHVVGWDDLSQTLRYLCCCGAETIRVMLPGYSRFAAPALRFEPALWERLYEFTGCLCEELNIPITSEPPVIKDLKARVAGVVAGSPAAAAGIRRGDIIETVNGIKAATRLEAFNMVLKARSPGVVVRRDNGVAELRLEKKAGQRSGLVMDYDLDPGLIKKMAGTALKYNSSRVLVLTSELAGPVLGIGLKQFWTGRAEAEAVTVTNRFFGGSIKAAGLLTVEDFMAAAGEYFTSNPDHPPTLVLLPGSAFDFRGRDLTGRCCREFGDAVGVPFKVL